MEVMMAAWCFGAIVLCAVLALLLKKPAKFLKKERQQLALSKKEYISHDTIRLTYNLDSPKQQLGLPTGMHFKIFAPNAKGKVAGEWNGREDPSSDETEICRSYTPVTSDKDLGRVELVVKVYKPNERFSDGGKMSQYLDSLPVGASMTILGPTGMHEYVGSGQFISSKKKLSCKKLGMIAGGTGITPMLQVVAAILDDPADTTEVSLIYANQTEDDILVRDLLEGYQKQFPKQFKLWYTLDRPPANWAYSTGFVTDTMIAEHLPGPQESSLVLMCGPPPMVKFACQQNLDKLGYDKSQQIKF